MKYLGELIAIILWALWGRWQKQQAEEIKKDQVVKDEGARAEETSQKGVSDVTGDDKIDFGTPDKPAPIKEGKNVPTKKKADDYFDRRNSRKRP